MARSEGKATQASLSHRAQDLIPRQVADTLVYHLGSDAYPVLNEWAVTLAERSVALPPLSSRLTDSGDEEASYGFLATGHGQYRPHDALSFDIVHDMLRNGQVSFGLKMKTAWLLSVFRNDRSWNVECRDERTVDIVRPLVARVLMRHAGEFIEALPYGAYFGEKVWDAQPAIQWGIDGVGEGETIYGYKTIRPVHPKSVDRILYKDERTTFDGFVQNRTDGKPVTVPADLSLVLTYDKRFRNLWGTSVLDSTYPLWFWYEIALRSFLRYLERMGTPVTVCEAPSRGEVYTPDGTKMRSMKYALIVAGHVGKSSAIALPSDVDEQGNKLWTLSYLADDKRGAQFNEALSLLGTLILRSLIIGDRAVVQGETGSYAAAARHFAVTMLHNEFVLGQFVNQINSYLIPQLVTYNVGAAAAPATMVTEGLDPDEKERLFKLLSTMGNQAGATSMDYIDWQRIFAIENVPVLSKEDYEALQEEKQKKAEEAMLRQQQIGGPGRPPAEQTKQEDEERPAPEEKAKLSAEWVLYNAVRGRGFPLMLTMPQAAEIVDRFTRRPFTLYNPYHDKSGRFTTAKRGGVAVDKSFYEKAYDGLSAAAKKVVAAPAEYLARKKGVGPKLARFGIEFASDIGINRVVSGLMLAKATWAGAAVTNALALAVFGATAPAAVTVTSGVILGLTATFLVSELLDYTQTKLTHAYVDRYSPKDDNHYHVMSVSGVKKASKVTGFIPNRIADIGSVIHIMLCGDIDLASLATASFEFDEYDEYLETRLFTASVWPFVLDVLFDESLDALTISYDDNLAQLPGFARRDDLLVLDEAGAREFVERWAAGDMPKLDKVEFGEKPSMLMEELLVDTPFYLFNPFHDRAGRFAARPTNSGPLIQSGSRVMGRVEGWISNMPDEIPLRVYDSNEEMRKAVGKFSNGGLAAFHDGAIHITPRGNKLLSGNRKLMEHVVAHESIHGRLRSGGGHIQVQSRQQVVFEEGATDLMSAAFSHNKNLIAYPEYSMAVASLIRKKSHSNPTKAWSYLSDLHYRNDDPTTAPRLKPGNWEDVDWLLDNSPRHLEEQGDEENTGYEAWVASERLKWSELYGLDPTTWGKLDEG